MSVTAVIMGKDEAARLPRAIKSLLGKVDHLVYVDTGSGDGSVELVRSLWEGADCFETNWIDFGYNRSLALKFAQAARPADYLLVLDCDQTLEGDLPKKLVAGAYELMLKHGTLEYPKVQLFSTAFPWRYEGATHEYLTCDQEVSVARADATIIEHADSNRRNTDQKFEDDIRLLEGELSKSPGNTRTMFYLARSYEDCGAKDKAVDRYTKRSRMGGYQDEVFYSFYRLGILKSDIKVLFKAMELAPARWEPVLVACQQLNREGLYQASYILSKSALARGKNATGLFIDRPAYDYLLEFEHTISAFYVGQYAECRALSLDLLGRKMPSEITSALARNMKYLEGK